MCGIFAYSGPLDIKQVLIKGLKNLEYRGYDSAGIAFISENKVHRLRVCGGVEELKKKSNDFAYTGSLGIGHTRWATHGSPSEKNAHPHNADFIYVVHNGVIENEEEIKKIIDPKNLSSDTDTEVIPHLIYYFLEKENLNFLQSLFKTVQWLKGSYAVVVINEKSPEELIAFKSGPPLIFCRGTKGFFISSDSQALGEEVEEVIFLEDEQLLHLKKDQFQFFNFQGEKMFPQFQPYSPSQRSIDKGQHPHFMLKEILEQPETLRQLIAKHIEEDRKRINFKLSKGNQKEFERLFQQSKELLILACGSSYHAALFAKYFLESLGNLKVNTEIASEFIYRDPVLSEQKLVLFISQSGETADILTALKQTKKWGLKSLSLCNVQNSSLERQSDFAFSMEAGPEIGVASTKTFSASLTALFYLAFYSAKLKKGLKLNQEQEILHQLLSLPSYIEKALSCDQFFLEIMEKLKTFKAFFYLGRGAYYPIALEGALKLKEIAYLHAEAYPSGEMKHGPLAMIDKNTAVLALIPNSGVLYTKSLINLKEVKSRGACIISIGGKENDKELKALSDYFLPLPDYSDYFHPLLALIPLQMMAYYISRSYGYNADKPRNLAKSVTVE